MMFHVYVLELYAVSRRKAPVYFAVARCRRMQAKLRKKRKSGEALVVQQDMEVSVHLPVFAHLSICVSAL